MDGNELVRQLKEDLSTGPYVENNPAGYRVRVVLRGEHVFYQEGNRALIAGVSPDYAHAKVFIHTGTVDAWDDGTGLTEEERRVVVERVVSYFRRYQNMEAALVC